MHSLCVTILVVFVVQTSNAQRLSKHFLPNLRGQPVYGDGHECQSVSSVAMMCTGFGYTKTELTVAANIHIFIAGITAQLTETELTENPAIVPFLCHSFVPKCVPGDRTRSILRPCMEACTRIESVIAPAIRAATGKEGDICPDFDLLREGEGRCVGYKELNAFGESKALRST